MPEEDKKMVPIDTSGPDATVDIEEQKDEAVVETENTEQGTDKTFENESTRDTTPMVRISVKEYNDLRDQAKEAGKYITDPSLISIIDKLEELTRALRKHIIRKF